MYLFIDMTRLTTRMMSSSPTGIDRVEFGYVSDLFRKSRDIQPVGVITTPWGTGSLRRQRALDVIERVERAWELKTEASRDVGYVRLLAWIEAPPHLSAASSLRIKGKSILEIIRKERLWSIGDFIRAKRRLFRRVQEENIEKPVYIHTSHFLLEYPKAFRWIKKNDVPSIFFVHDVIPIDYPEYCAQGSRDRHLKRLETVSELADLVLVNSNFTARALASHFSDRNVKAPAIKLAPLAIDDAFLKPGRLMPSRADTKYFVCIGTIEPRKNLSLLMTVWRRLVERHGIDTPRLVLVGRRGWENENVVDYLERSAIIAPFVAEIAGLTDAGLASLVAGAAAVLSPSLIEGFGLPIAESLTLGVPVIASDIEAHREVGGDCAIYLDPIDGPAWVETIEAFMQPQSSCRAQAVLRAQKFKANSWSRHVDLALEEIMASIGNGRGHKDS
jgi:glycosyltransferase involved in cell wall biosynthesis